MKMTTERCFVIQPFDKGKFDKRYEDIFKPAIEEAGLEPYRVDRDLSVDVPIQAIEREIRDAAICLADITTDNPNVWYELGFAFAANKPVVMVCSEERKGRYPFDIQHRTILKYTSESMSDFEDLKTRIKDRILAILAKPKKEITDKSSEVVPQEIITQAELAIIASIAKNIVSPSGGVSLDVVKAEVERNGVSSLHFLSGYRKLLRRGYIDEVDAMDAWGNSYTSVGLTDVGLSWIELNENRLKAEGSLSGKDDFDDLPF